MRFSPCIEMLFREESIPQRLQHVKELGFSGFEFWGWEGKNIDELIKVSTELDLTVTTFCTAFVSLVDAKRREEYVEGLKRSIDVARRLGCQQLITQTGAELSTVPREDQLLSLIDGLNACVPLLEANRITLLVEPLNILVDHKGYFLSRSAEAFDVVRAVNSPYVKVLYDIYHQQITEGNLIPTIRQNIDLIGHFHVADHPGRHEPGTGEINYHNVLKAIKDTGYDGWIGLEYRPSSDSRTTLENLLDLAEGVK
ncbi:MAG: TIM barrel protein [Firmicutes bacterium]|nr:TIM barrel protein [Bacillota bacterium]